MKVIKSFYTAILGIVIIVFCLCFIGQRINFSSDNQGQVTAVTDTDMGLFLASQHAMYVNDFAGASKMVGDIKDENKTVSQIKNMSDFFSGKMPLDVKSLKNSKDYTEHLIYDTWLIQNNEWKSLYSRHSKDTTIILSSLRVFSGVKTGKTKDVLKFVNSLKVDENWKSFLRGQIAVLNDDIDTATKEFAKVHPDFMNVNDYLYLMSFYKHNKMFEDMDILRGDFLAKVGGMYMLAYTDIPDWSNYEGYANTIAFSIIQNVSHMQVVLYTDLSLPLLNMAKIISNSKDTDALNYYMGQYYFYNSGDYKTAFNAISKSSPLYLFGQLKMAEKDKDIKAIEKIVRKNPLFVPGVQILGQQDIKNGKKAKALRIINRALKQKNLPVDGQVYFLRQRAYINIMFNNAKKAQKDLTTIKIIADKISPEIMSLQAHVWDMQNKKLDEAYKYAMTLVKINTSDVLAWDLLAQIVAKRESIENAIEILENIEKTAPVAAAVHEHLGDFYKEQGDKEMAKKEYLHALDLSDDCSIVVPVVKKKIRKLK